ncbi:unnamed protein product [Porites evermanni]|uniref:Maturase K n=1 Tax=Porites evermanni TaxID=104178 RepID=A0ABN8N4D3_9CNID|nr:unnamed protein product [Porites evermanni]
MFAKSHRDLREITNVAEFLARSLLSRRKLFHIGVTSFVSQKYLSSRANLRDITNLAEFLARSRRYLVYLAATAETLPILPSYWRHLGEISFISPRSQRHYKSRRVLDEISARSRLSRRDLRHEEPQAFQGAKNSRRD